MWHHIINWYEAHGFTEAAANMKEIITYWEAHPAIRKPSVLQAMLEQHDMIFKGVDAE